MHWRTLERMKHDERKHHHHHPTSSPPSAPCIVALEVHVRYHRSHHLHHPTLRGFRIMTTATLVHTTPTTRLDGSPLNPSDIRSIEYFDDTGDGSGPQSLGVVDGAAESFTTGQLLVGQHSITAKITDTKGHVSPTSNTASFTVEATLAAPSPITDLAATVNQDA